MQYRQVEMKRKWPALVNSMSHGQCNPLLFFEYELSDEKTDYFEEGGAALANTE